LVGGAVAGTGVAVAAVVGAGVAWVVGAGVDVAGEDEQPTTSTMTRIELSLGKRIAPPPIPSMPFPPD
jgi:hypothetical protein